MKFGGCTKANPPNLFSGAHNAHGRLECVAVEDMGSAVTACAQIAELWERKL